ncbi:DUF1080 domain-containing protein [Mariniflexile jejuense]|uniref:DUF1080 domain-containing protein n=1 Tax=Mariniflexile jejuense TaxID=1173582 RepID=A0ABW3JHA7_9FLAO
MKHIVYFAFILVLILPEIVISQSKIKLFNGKNLDGWYAFDAELGKQADASKLFHVEKNKIRLYGNKAGYLMSNQSFKNFELTVKFKWNIDTTFVRKSDKKNSGVMYLVPLETPDELWPKGIQFQIKEGATGDFVLLQNVTLVVNGFKTEAGRSVSSVKFLDAEKPFGKWNTLVITHTNGKITQKLNGKLVNEGFEASVLEGRILLQYEGFPIDFCKINLKKI